MQTMIEKSNWLTRKSENERNMRFIERQKGSIEYEEAIDTPASPATNTRRFGFLCRMAKIHIRYTSTTSSHVFWFA